MTRLWCAHLLICSLSHMPRPQLFSLSSLSPSLCLCFFGLEEKRSCLITSGPSPAPTSTSLHLSKGSRGRHGAQRNKQSCQGRGFWMLVKHQGFYITDFQGKKDILPANMKGSCSWGEKVFNWGVNVMSRVNFHTHVKGDSGENFFWGEILLLLRRGGGWWYYRESWGGGMK